ncbi:MAG: hemolysin family protein [Anaerolineae bacterium]|nr:hemolysin family protein [Anaerolineae bacterium]
MEDGDLSSLIIFLLLLILHALVALTYAALVNSRQSLMREEAEEGSAQAQRVLNLLENFARLNVTYQLTLLFTRLAIAAIATINIAEPLIAANPNLPSGLVYFLVLGGTALLTLILGDLLPAAVGNARPDSIAMFLSGFMRLIVFLLSPLVRVTIFVSKQLSALFGGDVADAAVTEEEIITLVDAGQKEGTIETDEKEMILSILQFDETLAREVMVPRMDIVALEIITPFEEALARFVQTGHSRIPLYSDSIDNVEGLLYAKDMLTLWHNGGPKPQSIRELMRPAHFVPESLRADLLLKELQKSKIHMAIVVDEYGGTAGLVTIENLIEEIVGDIQDEYDLDEEAEYVQENEDEYLIDAGMNLDDVNELLEVDLPTEDNDTLGGYIYSRIGRVPLVGEVVEDTDNELVMCVESVEGRRIRKVRVTRVHPEESPEEDDLETTPDEEVSRKAG